MNSEVNEYRLFRNYGLTLDAYEEILKEQNLGCAICGRTDKKLVVDHEHDSGAVRGLLCNSCNTGLGSLGDNLKNVTQAMNYLLVFEDRRHLMPRADKTKTIKTKPVVEESPEMERQGLWIYEQNSK